MKHMMLFIRTMVVALALNGCITFTGPGGGTEGVNTEGLFATLTDVQGNPVAGALVRVYPDTGSGVTLARAAADTILSPDSTWTDSKGRFSFPKLKKGRCNLECTVKRSGDTQSVFIPGINLDSKCDLGKRNLLAPGSILLKVQSEAGASLSGVKCDIPNSPFFSISDNSGKCLIVLPPGDFKVRLQKDGYLPALSAELQVKPGKLLDAGTMILTAIPPSGRHFPLHSSTVALWTFDSLSSNKIKDVSNHGFDLTPSVTPPLEASPFGNAMVFDGSGKSLSVGNSVQLTVGGTGQLTYEARIYMDAYPPQSNFNQETSLMGMYEGLKMQIGYTGYIQVGAQKLNSSGTGYWYAPASHAGVIPLHRWVDVAIAIDQTSGQCYAYIDGQPVQLSGPVNSDPFRISTSIFTVGKDNMDAQYFTGKLDEIRVSNSLVLGPGLPLTTIPFLPSDPPSTDTTAPTSDSLHHFSLSSSTIALWAFNSYRSDGQVTDLSGHGFHLTPSYMIPMEASPFGNALIFDGQGKSLSVGNSSTLTVAGTGKLTYEARIYMDAYPPQSNFNSQASLMGMYEGLRMQIGWNGFIQCGGQKLNSSGTGYWTGGTSQPGVVPLHRWVDVAIAIDQSNGQCYAYIDGVPVQLTGTAFSDPFRISTSIFTVGKDNQDDQFFTGKLDEIRVSNSLVLGPGLPMTP